MAACAAQQLAASGVGQVVCGSQQLCIQVKGRELFPFNFEIMDNSFSSEACQKGYVSTTTKVLNGACTVGTVASVVFPAAAPVTGAVCGAAKVVGVVNNFTKW